MRNGNSGRIFRLARLLLVALLVLPFGIAANPYMGVQFLPSSTPQTLSHASYVSSVALDQEMPVKLWLKLPNQNSLEDRLHAIYTPGNPSYHKFLDSGEFVSMYAPSDNDLEKVRQYLEANGFTIDSIGDNNAFVEAHAKVSQIQSAFHVHINNYIYHGQMHYSNDGAVGIDASIADKISNVAGLDDFVEVSPDYIVSPDVAIGPANYTPRMFQAAYGVDRLIESGIDGTGQTIAVVIAYDNPQAESNLNTFSRRFNLPACTTANGCFTKVNQSGNLSPLPAFNSSWATETDLDLQSIHSLAPNAKILLVEADSSSYYNLVPALYTVISKNLASVISNSWGSLDLYYYALEQYFLLAATNGITVNFSSGDYSDNKSIGGGYINVDYPASSPYVTAVGGTRLLLTADVRYKGETGWSDPGSSLGSGGGLSYYHNSNEWQLAKLQNISAGGYGQIGSQRAIPDISMDADPHTGAIIYSSGQWVSYGGTSLACPQFSALVALSNQLRAKMGKGTVGLLAPLIYNMSYSRYQGNAPITNIVGPESAITSVLSATPGWNDITGLGSPYAPLFIESLATGG